MDIKRALITFYLIILYIVLICWLTIMTPTAILVYLFSIDYLTFANFRIDVALWQKILNAILIFGIYGIITFLCFLSIKYAKKFLSIEVKLSNKYLILSLTMFILALNIMNFVFFILQLL